MGQRRGEKKQVRMKDNRGKVRVKNRKVQIKKKG